MGYVQKLETGYRARWRDRREPASESFARPRDAVQFLRTQETAVDRGDIDAQAGRIAFAAWAEHYFTLAGSEKRTSPASADT